VYYGLFMVSREPIGFLIFEKIFTVSVMPT
jgi:hypothetical protein